MVDVAQLVEPRIVIPAVVGSSPIVHPNRGLHAAICLRGLQARQVARTRFRERGLLAQLVEQLTLNQLVIGSSPIRPTTFPV